MRHLRAIIILLHVFAINIIAFPTPRGALSKKHVQKADIQESMKLWHNLLLYKALTGRSVEQFSGDLVATGRWLVKTQKNLSEPFIPYYRYAGTRQSWQMFGYVQHTAGVLNISLKEDDEWKPLYVDLDENYQWQGTLLKQERVRASRSLFAQRRFKKRYDLFVEWMAQAAFTDFPNATEVRVFYQQRTIPKPDKLRTKGPKIGEIYWERTIERDQ